MKRRWISSAVLAVSTLAAFAALPATPALARICPQIVQPVCALTKAGTRETFTNSCMALAAHARILHAGDCFGPICFELFMPVCARDPVTHRPKTYSGPCQAENADAKFLHKGACSAKP